MLLRACLIAAFLVACGDEPSDEPECPAGDVETRVRYESATVPFGSDCTSEQQTRTCSEDGWSEWSGTYESDSCAAAEPRDCQDPAAAHGAVDERSRYQSAHVPFGETCEVEMQTRTCWDGTWSEWSGTYAEETCAVDDPSACTDPDTEHGGSDHRTRYATASVPFGSSCEAEDQTRTCSNGAWSDWSGTYAYETCSVEPPLDCESPSTPHGGIDTRTRYASAAVPYGSTCDREQQQRTCWNGEWSPWSGTYTYAACTVPALVAIRIMPGEPVLSMNQPLPIRAIGELDDGNEQDITGLVTWSSANPLIVAFTASPGLAMGQSAGSTTIAADTDGKHAESTAVVKSWTHETVTPYAYYEVDFAGDQQGRAIVAWGDYGSTQGSYVVKTRAWNNGWAASASVAEEPDEISYVRATINPRGDQHVLWKVVNWDTDAYYLRASQRNYQSSIWSAASTLGSSTSNGAAALALSHAGGALATWNESIQRMAAFIPQSGWSASGQLLMRRGYDVAVDAFGNGIILGADTWLSPTVGSGIYAYHYDHTTNLIGPRVTVYETANTGGTQTFETAIQGPIGMDALGNAITVWVREDGNGRALMSSRYIAGSGWQAPEVIQAVGSAQIAFGSLAVHASGKAAFAFSSNFGSTHHTVFAVTYTPQTGWGIPVPLSSPAINSSVIGAGESVAVAADGRALAVWSEPQGTALNLVISRYDPEVGWGPREVIDTAFDFSDESAFALTDGFFVGYVAGRSDDYYIESAIFR